MLSTANRRALTVVTLCFSVTAALLAAGRPPVILEVPLVLTVVDAPCETGSCPGLASDTLGTYTDGTDNVLAILQGSGNFRFFTQSDTRQGAVRNLCYDFGDQLTGLAGPLPLPSACVNVGQPMHAYATGDVAIQNLTFGQSVRKLTRFAWTEGSYTYRLGYGTDMDANGIDSPAVRVTCTGPTTGACGTWSLVPESAEGTAALFRFPLTIKGKSTTEGPAEFIGLVRMPFVETFTRK